MGRVTAIPKPIKTAVLKRDNYRCMLRLDGCLGEATEADHRANRGAGGSKILNSPECLVAACVLCNGKKETVHGAVLGRLKDHGLRVVKAATNAATLERCRETPVVYPDGTVRKLLADGTSELLYTEPPF